MEARPVLSTKTCEIEFTVSFKVWTENGGRDQDYPGVAKVFYRNFMNLDGVPSALVK